MNKQLLSLLLLSGASLGLLHAQQHYTSPPAETSATIDGKNIVIHYHAPSMHGRHIFNGAGALQPDNTIWRAGANNATALHTDADLKIGDLSVPKGDYTLYVWLDEGHWQLVVNKQTGQWGTVYNKEQDLGRVPMNMSKPSSPVETYKMTLSAEGGRRGKLELAWENVVASVPIEVQ